MSTVFSSDLAAQQSLALMSSDQLVKRGDILTGQVQSAHAKVHMPVPVVPEDHTVCRLCWLPSGCRLLQPLCKVIYYNSGVTPAGKLVLQQEEGVDNIIAELSGAIPIVQPAEDMTSAANGSWVVVEFSNVASLDAGAVFGFDIVYVSIT